MVDFNKLRKQKQDPREEYLLYCSECESKHWYLVNLLDCGINHCYIPNSGRCGGMLELIGTRKVDRATSEVVETNLRNDDL